MKLLRQTIRKLLKESIDYGQYIERGMDFEALNTQINVLLNATADPNSWKQIDHANTEVFIFMEPEVDFEDEDFEPWYVPWHDLEDAFKNAGIPNYHDLSLWQMRNLKEPSWYTEIKKSRMEGGRKIPQLNIFHLVRPE
tara:strand:+ start:652 stop:1068 length:417 start_codon:yes stop_codon:yes gene_type:complete